MISVFNRISSATEQSVRVACMTIATVFASSTAAPADGHQPPPIIDMHLHALQMDRHFLGPPPHKICAPFDVFPAIEAGEDYGKVFANYADESGCKVSTTSPMTGDELMQQSIEALEKYNVYGVTSGPMELVEKWRTAAPNRIIPAIDFWLPAEPATPEDAQHLSKVTPDYYRELFETGRIKVFGEVALQYQGVASDDERFDPYLAMAEELDMPVGIHIGTGPPGAPYLEGFHAYRARLHSPLHLEDALLKHPKLRLYVMHAGWPMLDDTLALLYAHPQVYVEVGVINWVLPRAEFHRYLRRIVEAGFGNRIMFGSDQMVWPETIRLGIEAIESAEFLSKTQKRDIFYNNAARFLRFSEEEIAAHHGK